MDVAALLEYTDYSDSFYLEESRFSKFPVHSHTFHVAKEKCGLKGVYTLQAPQDSPLAQSMIPVVYVCKADSEEQAVEFHRLVWNQNIVPFLLVESPRHIRLYPGFEYNTGKGAQREQHLKLVLKDADSVLAQLSEFSAQSINNGTIWNRWNQRINQENRVDSKLLGDLDILSKELAKKNLDPHTAHSLIGKYVYLHYLKDRQILSPRKLSEWNICENNIFGRNATADGFYRVCEKLDLWLNGTVFPLSRENGPSEEQIRQTAAAFSGDDPKTGQMHLGFKAYDFQHIPIETLSNVYEQFLHEKGGGNATGAYYTPIFLVNFILDELETKKPLQKGMTVFDPSCGSGAFLVQSYRRLIEKEIGTAPNRKLYPFDLRELLVGHIFGLDVDEDACGIAELSLTMTLLDYVEPPDLEEPVYENFTLPCLRNRNIFHCIGGFFDPESEWTRVKPVRGYDWIVGNPPWKSAQAQKDSPYSDVKARKWMLKEKSSSPVPNYQIAAAFAWKAARHISDRGSIGLLMPALLLFNIPAQDFRSRFFSQMNCWCVVNFANLRRILFKKAINPAAAFFYTPSANGANSNSYILTYAPFATNQLSRYHSGNHRNSKWAPLWAITVNGDELREISVKEAASGDSLPWKLAMWGSHRDKYLLTSLARQFPSFDEFRLKNILEIYEGVPLRSEKHAGLKVHRPDLINKNELIMSALHGLREVFSVPKKALRKLSPERAYIRKNRGTGPLKVSEPPHVLVDAARRFAIFSNEFFLIPPRQIGIAGKPHQKNLLKVLVLYFNSEFFKYHQFFTSAFLGIERDRAEKDSVKKTPIPLDELKPETINNWANLYDELAELDQAQWERPEDPLFASPANQEEKSNQEKKQELIRKLNDWVYDAMGIRQTERWLIEDLLNVRKKLVDSNLPKDAVGKPNHREMLEYANALKTELDNFLDHKIKDQHRITIFPANRLTAIKVEHPKDPPAGPVRILKGMDLIELDNLNLLDRKRQWIYFHRNLKIYLGRTTYFIKPMQKISWLKSQALVDADEFIAEKLR